MLYLKNLILRNSKCGIQNRYLSHFKLLCLNTIKNPKINYSSNNLKQSMNRKWKIVLNVFGISAIVSGIYVYNAYTFQATVQNASNDEYFLTKSPPKQTIAFSIQSPADRSGLKITLYQHQTCPFCCKVRSFLDYYGFSYDVVEVSPLTRRQIQWTSFRKVPILVIEQQGYETIMLKDSSMIISALQSFIWNKTHSLEEIIKSYPMVSNTDVQGNQKMDIVNKYYLMFGDVPSTKSTEEIISERIWRKWIDEVYMHLLSPNIYRTIDEGYRTLNRFSKVENWKANVGALEFIFLTYVGPYVMYVIAKRTSKRHLLKDDVRISLYDETETWLKEIDRKDGKFLGGSEPNLADLGIYGVLSSIEECDTFQDLLNNTNIHPWFASMKEAVNSNQGSTYLAQRGTNKI